MTTIPQTGPISSVSALQEAFQLSLAIVDSSQNTRHHKAAFERLANDMSKFIDDMIHVYRIMEVYFLEGVPEDLAVVFQKTVNSLKSLRSFTRSVASRNVFMALFRSRSDMKKIKAHEETLAMNKGLFKMMANSYLQGLVKELSAETLNALMQRLGAIAEVEQAR